MRVYIIAALRFSSFDDDDDDDERSRRSPIRTRHFRLSNYVADERPKRGNRCT